jgi:hypothetical protein
MRTTWYCPITKPDFAAVGALLTGLVDTSHMCQTLTIYKVVWLALCSSLIDVIEGDAMCVGLCLRRTIPIWYLHIAIGKRGTFKFVSGKTKA